MRFAYPRINAGAYHGHRNYNQGQTHDHKPKLNPSPYGTGNNYDLTVTAAENIPLGAIVTIEGTIALDKDFGASYRYDLIMQSAVVLG